MNYRGAIDYLYALQKHGIKLGLENTLKLLSILGNPQDSFKAIHIAGTNGKGSTSAMIASILRAAGFKVGLFTSPHLVSFTERIKVNDAEIEEREVVELTEQIREVIQGSEKSFLPTFFEFVTAMGFLYFKRKRVEWAVVETGMGGRMDATNVLSPVVSVITNISFDHKEFLGETLREIAGEKAGIIKKGIPVVSSSQEVGAMEVIREKATEKGADLFVFGKDFFSYPKKIDMQGVVFDYEGKERLNDLYVPLSGMHQVENASVVIRTIELVMERKPVSYGSVKEGLAHVRWQGRLELIRREGYGYDFLIDGAHNPSASKVLAESLKRYFIPSYEKIILIMGVMSDKDIEGIMEPLLPLATELIFTAPAYERAASPERLAENARRAGFPSKVTGSVKGALELAQGMTGGDSRSALIVITGSFYTIGEAKALLGGRRCSTSLAGLR